MNEEVVSLYFRRTAVLNFPNCSETFRMTGGLAHETSMDCPLKLDPKINKKYS